MIPKALKSNNGSLTAYYTPINDSMLNRENMHV